MKYNKSVKNPFSSVKSNPESETFNAARTSANGYKEMIYFIFITIIIIVFWNKRNQQFLTENCLANKMLAKQQFSVLNFDLELL